MSTPRGTILKRCSFLLLVLVAIGSSAATLVTFRQAKQYYSELNATRLDPLGLLYMEVPTEPKDPTLVFYGDSRAEDWPEPSWLAGRTINLGIEAQTTEQILGRFEHHLAPFKPEIVVFQAGINDLIAIPLFPESEDEIIENCKRNIQRIVELCHESGSHVVLTTIFPVGKLPLHRRPFWSDRVNPAIEAVNSHIQSLASPQVTVLRSADILGGGDGLIAAEYSRDFLHLSAAGNSQLNAALEESVEAILNTTTREITADQGKSDPDAIADDSIEEAD